MWSTLSFPPPVHFSLLVSTLTSHDSLPIPTYLPLDLVLAIVRLAAARERRDEDSPAHHQRVAPLCLVCKAFKDAVEPLLWKSLVVEQMEQFHKFAGRSGRNTHLLDQVEEFRGGHYGSKAGIHHEGTEEAASVMRLYLPNLRAYRSRAFSRSLVSMKVFTKFQCKPRAAAVAF